jgi:hypothetical protein
MPSFESERSNVGDGWQPLLERLHTQLKDIDPTYQVIQIKEKFGGLRYHVQFSEDFYDDDEDGHKAAHDLIYAIEAESFTICEDCGTTDDVELRNSHGWHRTTCPSCLAAHNEAREAMFSRLQLQED